MNHNLWCPTTGRSIVLEAHQAETRQETLARLRLEVEKLAASRERLVLAADVDRRAIERDLHDGVQQHLIALAVNLQLAGPLTKDDPAAAKALIDEMKRDVQQALDDVAQLAHRIYPALLEAGGLAAALRALAVSAGIPATVDVAGGSVYPPEIARTVCLCWLEALDGARGESRARITVGEEEGVLVFEVVTDGARSEGGFDRLRDRSEALGGRMTVRSEPGAVTRVSGSLPLSR
jgi:signal transduction histidine kinase